MMEPASSAAARVTSETIPKESDAVIIHHAAAGSLLPPSNPVVLHLAAQEQQQYKSRKMSLDTFLPTHAAEAAAASGAGSGSLLPNALWTPSKARRYSAMSSGFSFAPLNYAAGSRRSSLLLGTTNSTTRRKSGLGPDPEGERQQSEMRSEEISYALETMLETDGMTVSGCLLNPPGLGFSKSSQVLVKEPADQVEESGHRQFTE